MTTNSLFPKSNATNEEGHRLPLPEIVVNKFAEPFSRFTALIGKFSADWAGVHVPAYTLYGYDTLQQVLSELFPAIEELEMIRSGDHPDPKYRLVTGYRLITGLAYPTDKSMTARENTDTNYLTAIEYDLRTNKPLAATRYIKFSTYQTVLNSHMLKLVKDTVDATVSFRVKEHLDSVTQSVRQAQVEIEKLQREREKIEFRIKKLKNDAAALQEETLRIKTRKSASSDGYVYLLQSPTGFWKIGRTRNPNSRLETFRVKLPFEVQFKCLIKTDDMYALEGELHWRYRDKRGDGEWFALSDDDVAEICALAAESGE